MSNNFKIYDYDPETTTSSNDVKSIKNRINERYENELNHVRGRVSLPTGLSDEEVLRLYHKLGELSIEAAKSNLAYEIIFEEWGLDKDKYSSFFRPVEQIYL